jgi:hypothetical protein
MLRDAETNCIAERMRRPPLGDDTLPAAFGGGGPNAKRPLTPTRSLFHMRIFWLPIHFADGGGATAPLSRGLVGW